MFIIRAPNSTPWEKYVTYIYIHTCACEHRMVKSMWPCVHFLLSKPPILQTSHYNVWNTVYQHTLTIHTIYTVRGGREETVREEGRCTNTDLWWGRGLAGTVCLWTGGVNKTSPHLPGHRVLIVTAKYGGGWALSRSPDWRDWERLGPLAYLCLRWWCTWTDKSRTWSCLDKLYFVELSPDWGDSASRYNYCQLSESRALPYGHTPLVKLLCACATIDQHSWQEELDFL